MKKIIPDQKVCPVCKATFLVGGGGNGKRAQVYCSWPCRSAAKVNTNGKGISELTVAQAAFAAGFIDADGHIGLYKKTNKCGISYYPSVGITNSAHIALKWFCDVTNAGSVNVQFKGSEKRKVTWVWNATAEAAISLLRQVRPFLVIKQNRADLVLEYHNRYRNEIDFRVNYEEQLRYKERITFLNAKGPKNQVLPEII